MEKLSDEVIEQIKTAVIEAIRAEKESDRLRQEIQAQLDFQEQCEQREREMEWRRKNLELKQRLFEEWANRHGEGDT